MSESVETLGRGAQVPDGPRVITPAIIKSEFTKLRSLRSTYWTLACAVIAVVGLGALFCALYVGHYAHVRPSEKAKFDPVTFSLGGLFLAQLAVGVLGVITMTNEYSSGMIKATFAAVPQRLHVLAAKAITFTVVTVVVCVIACFVAFFIGQAILSSKHLQTTIGGHDALRAVIGGGLYLGAVGLLGLALGALIRHTAGSIAILVALLLILPGLFLALPQSWQNAASKFLPSNAGTQIYQIKYQAHMLSPWAGFGVFCGYVAIALVAAAVLLVRRDA